MIEERLAELGIELPPAPSAIASYVPVRVVGRVAYVSGQVAMVDGVPMHPGKVGDAGSLDLVTGIAQLSVFVASAPGFTDQPKVANGASDLLVEIFGEAGKHSRAAVGVSELPLGVPVELTVIAEL